MNSFLESKGYRLILQGRNDVTHTRPPLFLRLWGITKEINDSRIKLGGVAAANQHGFLCKYASGEGKEVKVTVDVRSGRVYHVTFIDSTNTPNFFPEFADSLKMLGIPVGSERASESVPISER